MTDKCLDKIMTKPAVIKDKPDDQPCQKEDSVKKEEYENQDDYEVTAKVLPALADEMRQMALLASQNLLNARDYINNLESHKKPQYEVICAHCGKPLTDLELLVSTDKEESNLMPVLHQIGWIGKNFKRNLPAIELETAWENWQQKNESVKETALDKIKCPFCHEFPFDDRTFYIKHVTQIVLFPNVKEDKKTEESGKMKKSEKLNWFSSELDVIEKLDAGVKSAA